MSSEQDRLEAEIEQTREHLAGTVDELTAVAVDTGKKAGLIAIPVVVAVVVGVIWWKRRD